MPVQEEASNGHKCDNKRRNSLKPFHAPHPLCRELGPGGEAFPFSLAYEVVYHVVVE